MKVKVNTQMYTELPGDITVIDTLYTGNARNAACYLVESGGEAAFIETGTNNSLPQVLDALELRGISREQVKYVIPTHIHLDHAGGAGGLMEALPRAQLMVHPRGARHMAEPERLVAGSIAVYGEEKFREYYGDIVPIPAERIRSPEDNESLTLGERELLFRYTPGHANHHFCIWDEQTRGWFTGDNFGLAYPALACEGEPFFFPTTSPVQFDPLLLKQSLALLQNKQPERVYLTHYGAVTAEPRYFDQLAEQVDTYVDLVAGEVDAGGDVSTLSAALMRYTQQRLQDMGSALSPDEAAELLSGDLAMNAAGLLHWYNNRQ